MTVEEMLRRMSSYELSQWAAYEQAFGPLGTSYADDLLAGIFEAVQASYRDVEEDGPVEHFPRRHEFFEAATAAMEQREWEQSPEGMAARIAEFGADRWG